MKIYLRSFTSIQKTSALKRICKQFVFGTVRLSKLKLTYLAMLNLERYLGRVK